jgi:hypothetical protein
MTSSSVNEEEVERNGHRASGPGPLIGLAARRFSCE